MRLLVFIMQNFDSDLTNFGDTVTKLISLVNILTSGGSLNINHVKITGMMARKRPIIAFPPLLLPSAEFCCAKLVPFLASLAVVVPVVLQYVLGLGLVPFLGSCCSTYLRLGVRPDRLIFFTHRCVKKIKSVGWVACLWLGRST
jgi:hypothetical protein